MLAIFYGTSTNFKEIFRIVATCNSIFLFFRLKTFPAQKKNPNKRLIWKKLINRYKYDKTKHLWSPKSKSRVCSNHFSECIQDYPNGHIFVDSPSIRRRNFTWKVRGNYINFERRIYVEIMKSIRRGHFDVDSTFKIDEISMSSPRGFFYFVLTSNWRNFCTCYFYSIIS